MTTGTAAVQPIDWFASAHPVRETGSVFLTVIFVDKTTRARPLHHN